MTHTLPMALPEGVFVAHFTEGGLARLDWPRQRAAGILPANPAAAPPPRWVVQTRAALERVLAGKAPRHLPPLDLSAGTSFQQQVWALLRQIPPGQTRTYAELAIALQRPRAARAVGNACGANPIPLLIPCHRVLPRGGGLGGFSGPLEWKQRLLASEGRTR